MHPKGRANRHPSRRLALVGIALIAIVLAAAGAGIWDRRKATIQQARQEVTDFAVILAEQTDHSMQAAEFVLREILAKIRSAGIDDPKQFEHLIESGALHDLLRGKLRSLPQAELIGLIAADGRLLDNSGASSAPAVDLSGRKFFEYLRTHDDSNVYVGTTALARDNGIRHFFLTRRIDSRDDRFLGIAIIYANFDDLEEIYSAAGNMGRAIEILGKDCTILARYPSSPGGWASELRQKSGLCSLIEKDGTTVISPRRVDGSPLLVSLRPLAHFDLTVAVSVPEKRCWPIGAGIPP
jgi:hypothetical protein